MSIGSRSFAAPRPVRPWRRFAIAAWLAFGGHVAQARAAEAFGGSDDARATVRHVLDAGDHHGLPFAVVDKRDARLYVFDPAGHLLGATPVLLGSAIGDDSAPDVGRHAQSQVPAEERTTPAGRFESQPGHNLKGEDIVWVDYRAAFAIHRLRPADPRERRPQRLESATPADNRISLGCVVVPVAFYERVVMPTLGKSRGVIYVLPETRPLGEMLNAIEARADPS